MQDQESIEETYSCQARNILQVAENTIPKTSTGAKRRSPVTQCNEECETKKQIMKAKHRKHQDPTNKTK